MATQAQRQKVGQIVDGLRDEVVKTTSELVRIRSVNPRYPGVDYDKEIGGETRANKYLAQRHKDMGLEVDMWAEAENRENLVGRWRGAGGGRSLIYNGHIDTVPPGLPESWTGKDPFSGHVADGRVYGRGSCDMKGPVVAQLMGIKAIQEAGLRLKGDLLLESTVGEENMDGATLGAGATVKRGYSADAAVVAEPSAPPHPLAVVPVSPGLWWVSLTVQGKTSHAAMRAETIRAGGRGAEVAVDAIDKGLFLLGAIRKLEDHWGQSKKHPLFKPGHFSMLPGVLAGGPHGVKVPFFISDYCTIEYCIWHHPDEDPQTVRKEFEDYISSACQLDAWLREQPPKLDGKVSWPAYSVAQDHPICQTVARAHEAAAVGTRFEGPARFAGFYAVCDAAFLNAQGVPAIVYGPGNLIHAHAPDEHIEIDELMVATKTYALAAMDWCGVHG